MKKLYSVICGKYRKFETPKISKMKMKNYLKKKNQLRY